MLDYFEYLVEWKLKSCLQLIKLKSSAKRPIKVGEESYREYATGYDKKYIKYITWKMIPKLLPLKTFAKAKF